MPLTDDQWNTLIAAVPVVAPIEALDYLNKQWGTFSKPAVFGCADGQEYVVKSPRIAADRARAAVTEQIVSTLGKSIGAPVADIVVVSLSAALINMSMATIGYLGAGTAHGSRRIPNCSERAWLANIDLDENRPRFALLAVLYGWTAAADQQLIYHEIDPKLVYSVDHGFFFTGYPSWTMISLATVGAASLYRPIVGPPCSLTAGELVPAIERLRSVTSQQIAEAVAKPPTEWGFAAEERVAVAKFLDGRREQILAAI